MCTSLFILTVTLLLSPSVLCDQSSDAQLSNGKLPPGEQAVINEIIDSALADVIRKLRDDNQGKISIPDLHHEFTIGSTSGELQTRNGTFKDLTTLSRTEDATLLNDNYKFTGNFGFGLSKAKIEFDEYKLKYGIVDVDGKLSASVDGLSISAQLTVDYNQKPCRPVVDKILISEFGKIKVKVTGAGLLNKLGSSITNSITNLFKDKIVAKLEEKLRKLVETNLNKFDCQFIWMVVLERFYGNP